MPLIKRYSNRKLYDTVSKRYVTLEDVAQFIRQGEDVKVVDHVTGEDLTSLTLFQVIFEEEKKIGGLLPKLFLSRLIRTGGETVTALRSRLVSIDPFQVVDEEIRRRVAELTSQNLITEDEARHIQELLIRKPPQAEQPVRIRVVGEEGEGASTGPDASSGDQESVDLAQIEALKQQVQELEEQLIHLEQLRQGGSSPQ